MRKNQSLNVKIVFFKLEKDFKELKVRELKDKEVEIVSIDDMGNFEEKEMKKIRPIKNTWYNWLINYVPEPIRKSVDGFGDKFISLFKTNTSKQTGCGRGRKQHKSKTQK